MRAGRPNRAWRSAGPSTSSWRCCSSLPGEECREALDEPRRAPPPSRVRIRVRIARPLMQLVIVESPAKAKTIEKYLGADYKVLASYGHVRDLPSKDGSVRPDEDFAMSWDVDPKAAKRLADIAEALKGADRLILATDPDREGEAISWHV